MDIEHLDQDILVALLRNDQSSDGLQPQHRRTAEPALTVDEDKMIVAGEDRDRDQDALLIDRVSKAIQLLLRKDQSWIILVRSDLTCFQLNQRYRSTEVISAK